MNENKINRKNVTFPDSFLISPIIFLHPKSKPGVAVGMFLLSCMQAEIYASAYLLTVNGSHL